MSVQKSNTPHIYGGKPSVRGAYLSPEFLATRESCWSPIDDKLVFVGCGDDRPPTPESATPLQGVAGVLDPRIGYASVYGGVAGEAKNVLVVGAALYGPQFITDLGGFDGIMAQLIRRSRNPQSLHSAVGNEADQRHLCMQGNNPIGCAYCGGTGLTSALLTDSKEELIHAIAFEDQKYVFGSDQGFAELLRGHQTVLDHATNGKGSAFAFGRDSYVIYLQRYPDKLHLMMLDGSHAPAKHSGVITNFSLSEIGSAHKAHGQGLDFYRLDVAVVTDSVLQALESPLQDINPSYKLPAELLMRAFLLDAVPVRAVLAANDSNPEFHGIHDPRNLPIGVRGDQFQARQILEQRQASGYYLSS
ncbi:MAG TPA: hypothetical protein VGS08_01290 [Candidatus Saccharimonadales bacterium]|nr:hypothetical protein [Candidatus Saccharimonadales bacterium]